MAYQGMRQSQNGLELHGISNTNAIWWNLPTTTLYEHALQRREASRTAGGAHRAVHRPVAQRQVSGARALESGPHLSDIFTENTRASYPISHIPNATRTSLGGHPRVIIMLTADAFGVLPPVARLTPAQAMYHFLSGYTAKVAGTERGIVEPQATFSACFGSPFMALNPVVYANLLGEKIAKHNVQVWLINTGWSGGPYGTGERIKLAYTRAMVRGALTGTLAQAPMSEDPIFGLEIPQSCLDVPSEVLQPRSTWAAGPAYDAQAQRLAGMFRENFQPFTGDVSADIRAAGPR